MITDVPTKGDFEQYGIAFLNLAWNAAIDLALEYDEAEDYYSAEADDGQTIPPDVSDAYWSAAQKPLGTGISLLQQGIEFLLKARIAEVSPFLLVSGDVRNWPRGCDRNDVSFSAFRVLDAQDLVRAHDTVAQTRLPDSFRQFFDELRRQRNTIMHSVDRSMRVSAPNLLQSILEAADGLCGAQRWVPMRRAYLEQDHNAVVYSSDYSEGILIREVLKAIDCLPSTLREKYFDLKKQRRYICCNCTENQFESSEPVRTAQLRPNAATSTLLYCVICRKERPARREACAEAGCQGNVIDAEDGVCVTCGR